MRMRILKTFILIVIVISMAVSPAGVFAAENTFTTSLTTFGVDTTPPSIPQNLVAIPISSSQINLSWDASIDDFSVGGYRIFRDSIFLATTTLVTYSDIGLSPHTTYMYEVEAFDNSMNLSGLSDQASTTTLEEVIIPPTPVPDQANVTSSGQRQDLIIYDLNINPSHIESDISFKTNMISQAKVFWGITPDFEMGSLSVLFYGTEHKVKLTGLSEGVTYFTKIEATNIYGVSTHVLSSFRTIKEVEEVSLANPSNFIARGKTDSIDLSWNNPIDERFDSVRIVRSDNFFPKDQFDGYPIYEGKGEFISDKDVEEGKTYYYAAFAKSKDGKYSSGSLASAKVLSPGEIEIKVGDPFANIPQVFDVDPIIKELTISDFEFIQQGRLLANLGNGTIAIDGSKNLLIRLKYDKVPEILKTIAITLTDPEDENKVFTFLLRVNSNKTAYEATIGALGKSGNYSMSIIILDYQNQGLKKIYGNLRALVFDSDIANRFTKQIDFSGFIVSFIFIIIFLIILIIIRKIFKKDEKHVRAS